MAMISSISIRADAREHKKTQGNSALQPTNALQRKLPRRLVKDPSGSTPALANCNSVARRLAPAERSPAPEGAALACQLLFGYLDQAVGCQIEGGVCVVRRLLDLQRPRTREAQRQVALLLRSALAGVDPPELDAQLRRRVVDESRELANQVLLGVLLQALAQLELLSLQDDLHAEKMRPQPRGGNRCAPRLARRKVAAALASVDPVSPAC